MTFKLVDDWAHQWWRLWSMRLGIVFAAFVGWIGTNPGDWQQAMSFLPDWVKPTLGPITFAVIFYARMKAQPVLQAALQQRAAVVAAVPPEPTDTNNA